MTYVPVAQRQKPTAYTPVQQREKPQVPALAEKLPYTMGGALRPAQAEAPKSALASIVKATPKAVGGAWSSWTESEKKRKAEQTFGERAVTELVKRPAKIIGFLAGALGDLGETLIEEAGAPVRSAVTGESVKDARGAIRAGLDKPDTNELQKKIFGYEFESYRKMSENITQGLDKMNALPVEKQVLPTLVPALMLLTDLVPGGKPAKKLISEGFERISKEASEDAIRISLNKIGVPESMITENLLKQLVEAGNVNKVKAVIRANIEPETKKLAKELTEALGKAPDDVKSMDGIVPSPARVVDETPTPRTITPDDVMPPARATPTPEAQALTRPADELAGVAQEMKRAGKTFDEFVTETKATGVFKDTPETKRLFTEVEKDVKDITNLPRVFEDILKDSKQGDDILGKLQQQVDTFNKKYDTDYQATDLLRGSVVERDILNTATQNAYAKSDIGWDYAPLKARVWDNANTTAIAQQPTATPAPRQATAQGTQPARTPQTPELAQTPSTESVSKTEQSPAPKDVKKDSSYTIKVDDKGAVVKANIGDPVDKVKATTEEMDAIADISYKDTVQNIQTSRANGVMIPERNLIKEIEANIIKHSDKIPDEAVAQARNELLLEPETVLDILARKRGIVTDAESIRRASEAKVTMEEVLNLPKGTTLNAEQITAVKQVVQYERDIFTALKALANGKGIAQTPAERRLLQSLGYENTSDLHLINEAMSEAQVRLRNAEAVQYAVGSELGRALRSYGNFVEGIESRMRIVLGHAKKLSEEDRAAFIESLGRLNLDDNKVFMETLDELVKADIFDKVAEYMVAVKLWNPTTHVVNIGGNAARQIVDLGIKTVTIPTVAKADWTGAAVGLKQGLKNGLAALTNEGYASNLSKYIELGGQAPAIKGAKGKVVRYPFQMLAAGDEIFRAVAFNRSMYRQAFITARKEGRKGIDLNNRMRELLEKPTLSMNGSAVDEAKRMTFQEDIGELIGVINKLRTPADQKSWYSKTFALLLRAFVPFLKTPTNLFKQSLDFSPVGLLKNNKALRTAIKQGDKEKVGTIIGEAVVGTAMMYYFWEQYKEGNVTGGAPREKSEKDKFYRENKLPYAIKVGNTWMQYKRVDPFATMIGLTADVATLQSGGEDVSFGSVVYLLSQQLADKTYLANVLELMNLLGMGEQWEADYALKSMLLGGALPSIVGHTTRSIDPNVRSANTLSERFQAIIPGQSDDLPSQVNVLGYDIKRANKGLNYFFNPIQTESAYIEPVTKELMKINKVISVPQKYFMRDGVRYEFNAKEYERYAKKTGTQLRNELKEMFESSRYKNASIDKKEAMIDTARKKIQDEYKDEYLKKKTMHVAGEIMSTLKSGEKEKAKELLLQSPPQVQKEFFKMLEDE